MSPEEQEQFYRVFQALEVIDRHLHTIMSTQADLATSLNNVVTELQKVATETQSLLTKIDQLNAIIAAGGAVTPELQAAVDAVTAQAKVVDDLVPDAPAP